MRTLAADELAELAAKELRRTCVHEAGHATVLRVHGGMCNVAIWPNPNTDPEECAWRGHCQMFASPGTIAPNAATRFLRPAPQHALALVGLAGVVAEAMLVHGQKDFDSIWCEVDDRYFLGEFSVTDLKLMGEDWGGHIDEVIALLRENWAELEREANCLEALALAEQGAAATTSE